MLCDQGKLTTINKFTDPRNDAFTCNGIFKLSYNKFTTNYPQESANTGMKQYQFKTVNSNISGLQAKNAALAALPPFTGPAFSQGRAEGSGANSNTNSNISDMKNKLNELLKATEMLSGDRKNPPAPKTTDKNAYESKFSVNASWNASGSKGDTQDYAIGGGSGKVNSSYSQSYGYQYKKDEAKENKAAEPTTLGSYDFSKNSGLGKISSAYTTGTITKTASNEGEVSNSIANSKSRNKYESNYRFSPPKSSEPTVRAATDYLSNESINKSNRAQTANTVAASSTAEVTKKESVPQPKPAEMQPVEASSTKKYQSSSSFDYSLYSTDYSSSSNTGKKEQKEKPIEIPNSLSECQYKLRSVDQELRKVKEELREMTDGKEYYRKELSQEWRNNKKQKEEYEQKITEIKNEHAEELRKEESKHKQTIEDYEVKIANIKKEHGEEIQKLEQVIAQKEQNIIALVNEVAEAKVTTIHECYEEKAKRVLESNESLIASLKEKECQVAELKSEIVQKSLKIDELTQKLMTLEEEVVGLSNFKNERIHSQVNNFDEIMKIQLKSIAQFKEIIERLNEKNNELREKYVESSRKNEHLANEGRIAELKYKSTLNGCIMESAIELSNKENLISSLNKKIITLEEKYKACINEIKSKDEFLKQHLIGRTDSVDVKEYIEGVLMKYRQYFAESKEDQLKEDLHKAMMKIQLYEKYK